MILTPLAGLPLTEKTVAAEVQAMERMVDLLRRRAEASAVLADHGVDLGSIQLTHTEIIEAVAKRHSLSPGEVRSHRKVKETYLARHEVFYLMSIQTKADGSKRWSLPQIGHRVGGEIPFDHTTVLNGIRRHKARLHAELTGEPIPPVVRSAGNGVKTRPARPVAPTMICQLPADAKCEWCGAEGGAPCNDGARRG